MSSGRRIFFSRVEWAAKIFSVESHLTLVPAPGHKILTACQRGGVSNKPPWAPGSDKTRGQGSFGPFTGGLPNLTILAITTYKKFKKKRTVHLTRFFTKTGWAWHVTLTHVYSDFTPLNVQPAELNQDSIGFYCVKRRTPTKLLIKILKRNGPYIWPAFY